MPPSSVIAPRPLNCRTVVIMRGLRMIHNANLFKVPGTIAPGGRLGGATQWQAVYCPEVIATYRTRPTPNET
jgi:hypothetical protein